MLANISRLFKKGASSPSSKDRPNRVSVDSDHSGAKAQGSSRGTPQSGSRGRGRNTEGKDYTNGDLGPYSLGTDSPSHIEHYANGHSPTSPRAGMGFEDADLPAMKSSSPSTRAHPLVNGKPVTDPKVLQLLGAGKPDTDPKVLQLLGASEVHENIIDEWIPSKGYGRYEFSIPRDEDSDEDDRRVPDIAEVSWPQKSELPPSFEFARPTGKAVGEDNDLLGDGILYPDTGTSSSPSRPDLDLPHSFPFGLANRSFGEESSQENGTATGSEGDTSVDSVETHPIFIRTLPPVQTTFRPSPRPSIDLSNHSPRPSIDLSNHSPRPSIDVFNHSPRPSVEFSNHSPRPSIDVFNHSPRPSVNFSKHSPRPSIDLSNHSPRPSVDLSSQSPRVQHSPELKSFGANDTRPEGVSWGSSGSVSPRWAHGAQLSPGRGNRPLHPLPAPPPNSSPPPHATIHARGGRPRWIEVSNQRVATSDWQSPVFQPVQSPTHHRAQPRLSSNLSPLVSPLHSPPRSPMSSARPPFPPGAWSPLPTPPLPSYSPYQSPPKSPSRSPRTLSKWKKIKQIGVGSFGTVHEAINLDDGSFFAVKVSHDESIPAEIQKEIEVLSMLRHPNVVQYFGTAMEDGHLCIFLELMQNSLQSIIKVFQHFDETLISTYTRQILQGLEYLHRKNTIHRDIKCANILVDKDGQVKLADFGLAKEVGLSLATSCKGTPYFMAPEILKPHSSTKRGYGLPVDIWSLGCTVLEMADGQPPWSFLKGFSFFFKLNKGELPPIPQHLSQSCQDFIKHCLQFRPQDRPTASQLLLHPFVANAPATAAAAAFVSPSPAAMFMRGALVEGYQGRNGEGHQKRSGTTTSDLQRLDLQRHRPDSQHQRSDSPHQWPDSQQHRPDLQHHRPDSQQNRPTLKRCQRLDRSLNRSSSHPITGTGTGTGAYELPGSPRSVSSEAASYYSGQHHG